MAEAQTLISGEKKLAETNKAEQVTATSTLITGLSVKAKLGNASVVYIGPSTVGLESYWLAAGESVEFDVIDASRVYLYGKEGDGANFLGLVP